MIVTTALYASLLAFVFIALSRNTISARREAKVLLGDGGDADLLRHIRAHGNFTEYVPFALLLIGFAEMQGAPVLVIHALGGLLVCARLVHAFGISRRLKELKFRVIGVVATFITLIAGAITNLAMSIATLFAV